MRDSYRPAHRAKRSLPRLPKPRKPGKLLLTLAVAAVLLWSVSGPGRAFWNQMFLRSGFGGSDPDPAGLEIHVIDVGKADAILVRCQGHAGLIDTGAGGDGEDVADYLLRHGVKELEFVLLSHNDSDHIGGLPTVLGELAVDTLYQGELSVEEPSLEGAAMDRALSGWEGERRTLARGDSFSLGGASFSVLGPCRAYESSNDSSLVLRLEFGEVSALFCGDIEATAELDLVKSGQDLLQPALCKGRDAPAGGGLRGTGQEPAPPGGGPGTAGGGGRPDLSHRYRRLYRLLLPGRGLCHRNRKMKGSLQHETADHRQVRGKVRHLRR